MLHRSPVLVEAGNCRRRDFEGDVDVMRVIVIIVEVPTRTADCLHTGAHANVVSLTRPMLFKSSVF